MRFWKERDFWNEGVFIRGLFYVFKKVFSRIKKKTPFLVENNIFFRWKLVFYNSSNVRKLENYFLGEVVTNKAEFILLHDHINFKPNGH
jgi:hypothetical protein